MTSDTVTFYQTPTVTVALDNWLTITVRSGRPRVDPFNDSLTVEWSQEDWLDLAKDAIMSVQA